MRALVGHSHCAMKLRLTWHLVQVHVEHPESEEADTPGHASPETGSSKASPSNSAKAFVPTAAPVSRGNSANSAFIATTKPSKSSSASAAIVTTATGTSSQVAIRKPAPAKKGVIKAITKPVSGAAISAKSPYGFVKKAIQAVVGLFSDDTTVDFELMLLNTVQVCQSHHHHPDPFPCSLGHVNLEERACPPFSISLPRIKLGAPLSVYVSAVSARGGQGREGAGRRGAVHRV